MKESLLEILVEPKTGAALELHVDRKDGSEIIEGTLTSKQTGAVFPIIKGIPRFVQGVTYADSFGMQWNKFRQEQLDSRTGRHYSGERFDNETGWTAEMLNGKWTLDAGCGAGRFAEIAASRKANLVAVDISSAVEATAQTLASFPNAHVVQASIYELPFKNAAFDFVYSLGVIQHTPSPPDSVEVLSRMAKAGGHFAFTIYARRPWTKLNMKYMLRPMTRRLDPQTLLSAIEKSMPVLFPFTDKLYRLPVVGRVAQFAIPVANYVERNDLTRDQRYRECVLDTFDMLAPRYDAPMTWQETEAALKKAGVSQYQFKTQVPIIVEGRV